VRSAGEKIASAIETITIAAMAMADQRGTDTSGRFICFSLEFETEGHLAMRRAEGRLATSFGATCDAIRY
jgi:hypothetical protein